MDGLRSPKWPTRPPSKRTCSHPAAPGMGRNKWWVNGGLYQTFWLESLGIMILSTFWVMNHFPFPSGDQAWLLGKYWNAIHFYSWLSCEQCGLLGKYISVIHGQPRPLSFFINGRLQLARRKRPLGSSLQLLASTMNDLDVANMDRQVSVLHEILKT